MYSQGVLTLQTGRCSNMKSGKETMVCELTDASKVTAFAKNPTAICRRCGAKAHDSGSLCDPVQIPKAG